MPFILEPVGSTSGGAPGGRPAAGMLVDAGIPLAPAWPLTVALPVWDAVGAGLSEPEHP